MQTISVCSFKGGTAKTSISLNIGAALARFHQKRVLMIDFDAQANLTAGLGLDPDNHDSLAAVLQDNKTLQEVIVHTDHPQVDLIPADTWLERVEVTGVLSSDRYSHEKLKKVLAPLKYDIAIIDTPPSLCWLTESALIACNYALVCATPEFYSIKGLQRLSYFMHYISERHPFELLGVALSFWNARGRNNEEFLDVVNDTFPEKVLSTKIRRDIAVSEASIHGKPVFETRPKSRAAEDYLALTDELLKHMESQCLSLTPS
ncbi:MAG: ParA family protein [Chlamydiia bacterium]|nr:ParA family protein [Chlamydiia bacterium]